LKGGRSGKRAVTPAERKVDTSPPWIDSVQNGYNLWFVPLSSIDWTNIRRCKKSRTSRHLFQRTRKVSMSLLLIVPITNVVFRLSPHSRAVRDRQCHGAKPCLPLCVCPCIRPTFLLATFSSVWPVAWTLLLLSNPSSSVLQALSSPREQFRRSICILKCYSLPL
jgi:hypothetical protein